MTAHTVKAHATIDPYWRDRWDAYLMHVFEFLSTFVDPGATILEVGPAGLPMSTSSVRMDAHPQCDNCVLWDAGTVDWPFVAQSFDLVLALQVLEHVHDRQRTAFREARRVGRRVVITVPHDWQQGAPDHLHITDATVWQWCDGDKWAHKRVYGSGDRRRALYAWEDLL